MNNLNPGRVSNLTFKVFLVFVLPLALVWAGDEEMMNPYTEFDPETGFFIPIDQSTGHGSQVRADDEVAGKPDSKAQPPGPAEVVEPSAINSYFIAGSLIIVITMALFWIGFFRYRKSQENTG